MLLQSPTRSEKSSDLGMKAERHAPVRYRADGELIHSSRLSPDAIWARVRNVSVGGVALPRESQIEPDSELVIQTNPSETDMPLALVARVGRAIGQPTGDWLVRCDSLATKADLHAGAEVFGPARPAHSDSLARRVLRACYGASPIKRAVFCN
jgi:hypothetical protein